MDWLIAIPIILLFLLAWHMDHPPRVPDEDPCDVEHEWQKNSMGNSCRSFDDTVLCVRCKRSFPVAAVLDRNLEGPVG